MDAPAPGAGEPSGVGTTTGPGAASGSSAAPRMGFANQAALSVASQVASQVLVLGTALVMPRIIAPEVKGPCDLVMGLALPLIVFSNLGLSTALLYHPDRQRISLDAMISTVLTTAFCVGTLSAGIAALFLPSYFSGRHAAVIEPWHVALVLAACPLQLSTSYLNATQLVAGRIVGFNAIQFLPVLLYVGIFFGLYLGLGPARYERSPSLFLTSMVAAHVGRWTISAMVAAFLLRNVASFRPAIDWGFLKRAVRFGMRPYLSNLFQVATLSFTLYYLEALGVGRDDLGYYSLAGFGMVAIWNIPEAVLMVLANRVATMTPRERHWFTPIACRTVVSITLLVALAVGLGSELFLHYWAPRYLPAVPALRVLLAGSVVFTFFKLLQTDLLGRGRENAVPMLSGLTLVVLVAASVVVIGVLGERSIAVAAACTSVAMAVTGIVTLVFYARLSGNSIVSVALPQRSDWALWKQFLGGLKARGPAGSGTP